MGRGRLRRLEEPSRGQRTNFMIPRVISIFSRCFAIKKSCIQVSLGIGDEKKSINPRGVYLMFIIRVIIFDHVHSI